MVVARGFCRRCAEELENTSSGALTHGTENEFLEVLEVQTAAVDLNTHLVVQRMRYSKRIATW